MLLFYLKSHYRVNPIPHPTCPHDIHIMEYLAAISGDTLISAILWLVAGGLVYFVLNWALAKIALPEPFGKISQVVLILLVVVFILNGIFVLLGHPFIHLD